MSKKAMAILMTFVMVGGMLAGCAGGSQNVVGMITDTGGLGDKSFNDSAWLGLEQAQKELKVERKILQSKSANDYLPNLTSFADKKVNLIFGVGFLFDKSMATVADKYPNQKFGIIDSVVDKPNVASITFAENEGSFVVGVIAGLTTKTDKIGFIGGMKMPLIEKFEYGFRAGVESVNPKAKVLVNYADSFGDSAKGKEIALTQNSQGADVIYHAAGAVGVGLMNAAKQKGFWAIGVDQDQSALAPKNVLCSMVKKVNVAVFDVTKSMVDNTFKGGIRVYDASNGGIGYSDNAGNLNPDVKVQADKWLDAVKAKTFKVPATKKEFDKFEIPKI